MRIADYEDLEFLLSAEGQSELADKVFKDVWDSSNTEKEVDRDSVKMFSTYQEFSEACSSITSPDTAYNNVENGTCEINSETYEYEYDFNSGDSSLHHVVIYQVEEDQ